MGFLCCGYGIAIKTQGQALMPPLSLRCPIRWRMCTSRLSSIVSFLSILSQTLEISDVTHRCSIKPFYIHPNPKSGVFIVLVVVFLKWRQISLKSFIWGTCPHLLVAYLTSAWWWALLRKHLSCPWSACTGNLQASAEFPRSSLRDHNLLHVSTNIWMDFQLGWVYPLILNLISWVWTLRAASPHLLITAPSASPISSYIHFPLFVASAVLSGSYLCVLASRHSSTAQHCL